jgi:hypothetical protein
LHSRAGIFVVTNTPTPAACSPQVHVAGGFNNWSDSATPLKKQPDGSFADEVPIPWGEKQAFKYVVDGGEWIAGLACEKEREISQARRRWIRSLRGASRVLEMGKECFDERLGIVLTSQNGRYGRTRPRSGVSLEYLYSTFTGRGLLTQHRRRW